ncbi:MAG: hypothetical protein WD063_09730 [Pirellulales bacterium]
MKRNIAILAYALAICASAITRPALAQRAAGAGNSQQALAAAARDQKYTFIVFYKDNGPATQATAQVVQSGVDSRSDRATALFVDANSPAEKALVDRFGVSRAPMPLTIAVAPNGAITGMFPKKVTDEQIGNAFVSPTMAQCMKSMQEGKIVFVCIQPSASDEIPPAVQDFQRDPQFQNRMSVVSFRVTDAAEAEFLQQLKIDAATVRQPTTAFLAPPGVLIGKYGYTATKAEMAAALHKAGQCCDDPNCKHAHGPQATKNSDAKRN